MKRQLSSLFPSIAALTLALLIGCSPPEGNAEGYGRLGDIPRITDPVVATSRRSDAVRRRYARGPGALLGAWADVSWAGKSGPLCRSGNMLRALLSEAGRNDQAVCYANELAKRGFVSTPADGTRKSFRLMSFGEPVLDYNLQTYFTIEQDEKKITRLTMVTRKFNVEGIQDTFLDYRRAERVTMLVSSSGSSRTGAAFAQRTVVDGLIDDQGKWTEKKITHAGAFPNSMGSNEQQLIYEQTPEIATLDGYYSGTGGGGSYFGQLYAQFDLAAADTLATYALGNGAIKYFFVPPSFDPTPAFNPLTAAWTGDTRAVSSPATSSPFFADVAARTLLDVSSLGLSSQPLPEERFPEEPDVSWMDYQINPSGSRELIEALKACDARFLFPSASDSLSWADCSAADFNP